MVPRSFPDLVKDLRMRRAVGDKPPVLLLGAGASVDAGIGAMDELFQFFGCTDFDAFCQKIGQTTATERYRYLVRQSTESRRTPSSDASPARPQRSPRPRRCRCRQRRRAGFLSPCHR